MAKNLLKKSRKAYKAKDSSKSNENMNGTQTSAFGVSVRINQNSVKFCFWNQH